MLPHRVIIHHSFTEDSGSVSWSAIRRYHVEVNNWSDIGYHLGIERIGDHLEALIGRPWNVRGAHAAGNNSDSLGVCVVGNFDDVPPPPHVMDFAARNVAVICDMFGIATAVVLGHRELDGVTKSCPGRRFDMEEFRTRVARLRRP